MRTNKGVPQMGGVMTFDQIADELAKVEGRRVSRQRVYEIYLSALAKLRRSGQLPALLALAAELRRERDLRVSIAAKRHTPKDDDNPGNDDVARVIESEAA